MKAQAILIEKLRHQLAGHRAHRFGAAVARGIAARIGIEPDPEVVAQALGDPETVLALRRMEIEADAAERADALRAQEAQISDAQHARQFAPDDGVRRWLAILLPITAVIFGGAFISALIWKNQITEAVGIAGMILGWLIRDASNSTGFYFGTSLGSKKKSEELAAMERR